MKKNDKKQIAALSMKELVEKSKQLQKAIESDTMDKNMKKLKDVKSLLKKKKERALVLTILNQKKMLELLEEAKKESDKRKEDAKK